MCDHCCLLEEKASVTAFRVNSALVVLRILSTVNFIYVSNVLYKTKNYPKVSSCDN